MARDIEAARRTPPRASRRYDIKMLPPETPADELPPFLTSGQAAEWLDVSRKTISNMVERGDLHREAATNRRFVLFRRAEVVALRERDPRHFSTSLDRSAVAGQLAATA